jgi:hypothetical protein
VEKAIWMKHMGHAYHTEKAGSMRIIQKVRSDGLLKEKLIYYQTIYIAI